MAERRMFHTTVVESDQFLDLPLSTQALYFHLGMQADDHGFVNNPRRIARFLGARAADLDRLLENNYLIPFGDIVVITHFRIGNSLKNDRKKPFRFPEAAAQLYLTTNRMYTTDSSAGTPLIKEQSAFLDSKWNPNRTEPNRTEQNLTEQNITEPNPAEPAGTAAGIPADALAAAADYDDEYYKAFVDGPVRITRGQLRILLEKMGCDSFAYYYDKLSSFLQTQDAKVKNHYATMLKWWEEDRSV